MRITEESGAVTLYKIEDFKASNATEFLNQAARMKPPFLLVFGGKASLIRTGCEWSQWLTGFESAIGIILSPENMSFTDGMLQEAAFQRKHWGTKHDGGKTNEDWFWLLGYLLGKVLQACSAGDRTKALHHTISSAAALANWHAALLGVSNEMRPGISPPVGGNDVQG